MTSCRHAGCNGADGYVSSTPALRRSSYVGPEVSIHDMLKLFLHMKENMLESEKGTYEAKIKNMKIQSAYKSQQDYIM